MVFVKLFAFQQPQAGEMMKFDQKTKLNDLKSAVGTKVGKNPENLSVYFCDKELENDEISLDKFDFITEKSILCVFPKITANFPVAPVPNSAEIDNLLASLQATFSDAAHRTMLFRVCSDPETLQNLINCIPALRHDLVALAILRDPYLLLHWIENENVTENFTKHPCLYTACRQLIEHMHAEILRHNDASASDLALLHAMPNEFDARFNNDDDEDDSDADEGPHNFNLAARTAPGPSTPRQQITPQYLAAALAAVAGGLRSAPGSSANLGAVGGGQTPMPSSTSTASLNLPSGRNMSNFPQNNPSTSNFITPEMLRQAVQHAFPPTAANFDAQLAELKSMGFANDAENLRALTNSGGDVQAALEFIINERERLERENFGLD